MENRTSFGLDAQSYRDFRPVYPEALFEYLSRVSPGRDSALDCATGSGQAALALCRHFEYVVATDADPAQLATAPAHPQIDYRVIAAERLPADLGRFDLVTVAQGAHWFDLERFYESLDPLLRDEAIVAIWGYSFGRAGAPIDALLESQLERAVDPFWADGNRVIMDHYRTIPFPFDEIGAPTFTMHHRWERAAFFGFVRTWSAHRRLLAAGLPDPLDDLAAALDEAGLWQSDTALDVQFDLHARIGRLTRRA